MRLKKHNDSISVRVSSHIIDQILSLGYNSVSEFVREAIEEKLAIELNKSEELIKKRKKILRDKINVLKEQLVELEHELLYYEKRAQRIRTQMEKIRDEIELLEWMYNNEELRLTESVLEANPSLVEDLTNRFKDKERLLHELESGKIDELTLRNAIKKRLEACRMETGVPMNKLIQVFRSLHPELAQFV